MKITKQTVLKKKAKQLCCILLAAMLCIGMTVPVMAASSKYNAAVSSYKKYMRGKRGSYKIVDVDGNGIRNCSCITVQQESMKSEPTIPKQEKMYG